MLRSDHTIYFDITQRCNIGCDFCMYANKRTGIELKLNQTGKDNIRNIFQRKDIKCISISGEGEPLNNQKIIFEILKLSPGNLNFEIITSGAFSQTFFLPFLRKINLLLAANNDFCNIRLSADSYHISKIPHKSHGYCIDYVLKERPSNLSLSFRSIDIDRTQTGSFLLEQLATYDVHGKIKYVDPLTDCLTVDDVCFEIVYKNIVNPHRLNLKSYMTIYEYIDALEEKYSRPFTLGSMSKFRSVSGLDMTIKPDGDLCFYGIEPYPLGNILERKIEFSDIVNLVNSDEILNCLYTQPFRQILKKLSRRADFAKIIEETNNPYWVLKNIHSQFGWQEIEALVI